MNTPDTTPSHWLLAVLNPLKVWRGDVMVMAVFYGWGVIGNVAWQAITLPLMLASDIRHPKFSYSLLAFGFYLFTYILVARSRNGNAIIYDTGEQQKARYIWAMGILGFVYFILNCCLYLAVAFSHKAPPSHYEYL